jgi:hypothetical protein
VSNPVETARAIERERCASEAVKLAAKQFAEVVAAHADDVWRWGDGEGGFVLVLVHEALAAQGLTTRGKRTGRLP